MCGGGGGGGGAGGHQQLVSGRSDTFWDIVMKLHTLTPHESRMRPIDFKVKRSRSWGMVNCKWFPDYNWLCNQPMIMKLHTLAPNDSRMYPFDFAVQRSRSWGIDNWKWFLDHKSDTFWDKVMKLHTRHDSRMRPIEFGVKRSEVKVMIVNGFWTVPDSVINLWSWNFIHMLPMIQGCVLLILRSIG